ncbi:MAG: tail fiber protein [Vicingaceae bacterium]
MSAYPHLGDISMFAGNFAPRGWALCNGQLLPISSYSALFSLLGTIYGGDGRTTFALPDLRGRAPIHMGTGPGLTPKRLGQRGGTEYNILNVTNLPSHNHSTTVNLSLNAARNPQDSSNPSGNSLGAANIYDSDIAPSVSLKEGSVTGTVTVQNSGGNQSLNNMQPYGTINYIIALVGTYPSRS